MTPPEVYRACEDAWGRPVLDPCWHPASPVRPRYAGLLWTNFVGHKSIRRRTTPLLIGGPEGHPSNPDEWAVTWPMRLIRGYRWMGGPAEPIWGWEWAWLNPPYSNPEPWLRAFAESGVPGVALIKADPSTKWWNRWVWHKRATRVGFFHQRLRYARVDGGKQYAANFPSALVIYGIPGSRWPSLDIEWVRNYK